MEGRLPDVPWHIGFAKKAENDPRRHKARCIHNMNGTCNCNRSFYYKNTCGGSSHCEVYAETYEEYNKKIKEIKTADEIERDNIQKYKEGLKNKKAALAKSNNYMCYKSTSELRQCLVCDEKLNQMCCSLKKCTFCGMFYVDLKDSTKLSVLKITKAEEVFMMNVPRKKEVQHEKVYRVNHGICVHMKQNSRCALEESKRFKQHCKENGCVYFKKKNIV